GESLAASLYPFARSKPDQRSHRFNFSWFKGPLRPAEAWIFGATVVAALAAIPVAHGLYRAYHQPLASKTNPEIPAITGVAASSPRPTVDSAPPASEAPAARSRLRKTPPDLTHVSAAKPTALDTSGPSAESSAKVSLSTIHKATLPVSPTATSSP